MERISIKRELCKKCGYCASVCPTDVFGPNGELQNPSACRSCGLCDVICPERAIILSESQTETAVPETASGQGSGGWNKVQTQKPGRHLLSGNDTIALEALDAGCRFYAGYPITPASEIMYGLLGLNDLPDGRFIQMEDEISSLAAVIGAALTGKKAMTATSGPGLSLMQENISFAVMTETPCVIVDVMRAGPSTGQATRPAQGDIMPAIWSGHGDARKIVLAPVDIADCRSLTIEAFNLSEMFRVPVIILLDEIIAHLKETVDIPELNLVYDRAYDPNESHFGLALNNGRRAASLPPFGGREILHVTGSTHDHNGVRAASNPDMEELAMKNIIRKIQEAGTYINWRAPKIKKSVKHVIIACGSVVRAAEEAVRRLARHGEKVALIPIKYLSPFPDLELEKALFHDPQVHVIEMNRGQLIHLVREVCPAALSLTQNTGMAIEPRRIVDYFLDKEWERNS
ncbi:MAG: 4Fe-4S binding protein [Candidatus Falkowbacteria bacterium]